MRIQLRHMYGTDPTITIFDDMGGLLQPQIIDHGSGDYDIEVRDFDPVADIIEFHQKFGLTYEGKVRALPKELDDFRTKFMGEELTEYKVSAGEAANELGYPPNMRDRANYTYHLEQMHDALIDLIYVAVGTAYMHGFNFKEGWRRVHYANMMKVRAERPSDSKRRSTWDVVKPIGWEPPTHTDLVEVNDLMDRTNDEG